jgi:mono/diheme cytochrome c family protein
MRRIQLSTVGLVIAGLLVANSGGIARAQANNPQEIAAKVRDIFTASCFECHGGRSKLAGVLVLDRDQLVSSEHVVPGNADGSNLFARISATDDSVMPPAPKQPLSAEQIAIVKTWIAAGAPAFPAREARPPIGAASKASIANEYVLRSILADVRRLAVEDRKFVRYFSIAHIFDPSADKAELAVQREALAKAINHLSWQPTLVQPVPVETTKTVLRIDLRDLGWDKRPFKQVQNGKAEVENSMNIFDLALLEYPHGVMNHESQTYIALLKDFLNYADQIRPIPYVRGDWFVSTVTLPPLYEDFLQLPRTLKELEDLLGVDSAANVTNFKAVRGGMIKSGVSRNNRVVERHESKYGAYWKSFDFQSSLADENILRDPVNLRPAGGEMIFTLPNGLQGYFITDAKGNRIDSAPTSIVVDENASDKVVRNGLSCMRCHDRGMKPATDIVRPTVLKMKDAKAAGMNADAILQLYPEQSKLDSLLKQDEERFMSAMQQLLGKPQTGEPLKTVSNHFFDRPLTVDEAVRELGLNDPKVLKNALQLPQFIKRGLAPWLAGETVPRDAWEGNYEGVVRHLRLGIPLVTLDSLTKLDYEPRTPAPFELELKTNKAGNTFIVNDKLVIFVKPTKDVFIEVIATTSQGKKVILVPSTTQVKAGTQFRFPAEGKSLQVKAAGKDQITVFASEAAFRGGELVRGEGLADRVVHRFNVKHNGQTIQMSYSPNPFKTVKKTITIETR